MRAASFQRRSQNSLNLCGPQRPARRSRNVECTVAMRRSVLRPAKVYGPYNMGLSSPQPEHRLEYVRGELVQSYLVEPTFAAEKDRFCAGCRLLRPQNAAAQVYRVRVYATVYLLL
jgi:hypothetical protein